MKTTVLIVDDHPIMANSLRTIVQEIESAEVIGTVQDGRSCIDFVNKHQPHIIILDYHLPDIIGTEVTKQIKDKYPEIKIIIFTGVDLTDVASQLLELQVSGFLSKDEDEEMIKLMVNCVIHDHTIVPVWLFHQLKFFSPGKGKPDLSVDEIKIMIMVTEGKTNEEIAEQLFVSKRSVDNYLKKIYYKFGVASRTQAVQKFLSMD